MPIYVAPRNDSARLTFLKTAAVTAAKDIVAGNNFITQTTVSAITAFAPQMQEKLNIISLKLSGREKEVREKNEAADEVSGCVRDMWEVVKRRVRRSKQPAEVLTYYQLPLSGETPRLSTPDEWIAMGQQLVVGDAQAVAAGYPAMVNPSAADLNVLVQAAQSEKDDVAIADREYDQAQEALAVLRVQADDLIGEVMAQLRYVLRRLDASSQRRIMRTYGAEFTYLEGEPPDEPAPPPEP